MVNTRPTQSRPYVPYSGLKGDYSLNTRFPIDHPYKMWETLIHQIFCLEDSNTHLQLCKIVLCTNCRLFLVMAYWDCREWHTVLLEGRLNVPYLQHRLVYCLVIKAFLSLDMESTQKAEDQIELILL